MVGSSWYDSPAVHPSALEGRVALFLATAASHVHAKPKMLALVDGAQTVAAPKSKRLRTALLGTRHDLSSAACREKRAVITGNSLRILLLEVLCGAAARCRAK